MGNHKLERYVLFRVRSNASYRTQPTGKNSIASHPDYGIKGRVLLVTPYQSIIDQMAKEAHDHGNRENQIFVHSDIEKVISSFKTSEENNTNVNHAKSLYEELPNTKDLVVHTTYNQISNLNQEQLKSFDYIFIDEVHALTSDINFRALTITKLIYDLLEFIKKVPDSKTKIILMTGTPNAESLIIPEIMKSFKIAHLFQRVKISKKYANSPIVDLVHLDSNNAEKRMNAVMKQIKEYYKNGVKVVFVFNNKEKMDQINLMIKTKIDKNCKVGYFYSGSQGKATDNILSSKLGEYDVVLATKYFINGININQDGLLDKDIKSGTKSTQRYGLVIDLGNQYSKTSAIGAIQAINRFRNRLCHATIFFPKIFKKDENNPARKFHFGNAASLLLGINRYNVHLLSSNEEMEPLSQEEKEEVKEKPVLIDKYRNNYESLSNYDLCKITNTIRNKRDLVNKVEDKISVYEGWYNSLDGFNYLCRDAGFEVNIKHLHLGEPLKEMTEDQIELENKFVENFIKNYKEIDHMLFLLSYDIKLQIRASNKFVKPRDTNFILKSICRINDIKYIAEADFNSLFERVANRLLMNCFSLYSIYGKDNSLKILQALTDNSDDLVHFKEKRSLKSITNYVKRYRYMFNDNALKGVNYLYGIDELSKYKLGVEKEAKNDSIIYTVKNPELLEWLKKSWAKQQFKKIDYNLKVNECKTLFVERPSKVYNEEVKHAKFFNEDGKKGIFNNSVEEYVKQHYANEETINYFDLEKLEIDLNKLSNYTKLSFRSNGDLKTYETIVVPKVIYSESFIEETFINDCGYSEPEKVSYTDLEEEFKKFEAIMSEIINDYSKKIKGKFSRSYRLILSYLRNRLQKGDIYGMMEYLDFLISYDENQSNQELQKMIKKVQFEIHKVGQIFLTAFKYSEYNTFEKLKENKNSIYRSGIFLYDKSFELNKTIHKQPKISLNNLKPSDIFDELKNNSDKFLKGKTPRVTYKGKKISLNKKNLQALKYTIKTYVVLDEKSKLLYAHFDKNKACKFLCDYAFKNNGFKLKNGITPVKDNSKGIYNPITFQKDYFGKNKPSKTVENYSIEEYEVTVLDYINHVQSK